MIPRYYAGNVVASIRTGNDNDFAVEVMRTGETTLVSLNAYDSTGGLVCYTSAQFDPEPLRALAEALLAALPAHDPDAGRYSLGTDGDGAHVIRDGTTGLVARFGSDRVAAEQRLAERLTNPERFACLSWGDPLPPLPTEPGIYADSDGDPWQLRGREWCYLGPNSAGGTPVPTDFLPFTRLVPEAV